MTRTYQGRGVVEEGILVAVPVELKGLVEPISALIDAGKAAMRSCSGGRAVDYARIEISLAEKAASIERACHASVLRALEVDASDVEIGGRLHRRIGHAAARRSPRERSIAQGNGRGMMNRLPPKLTMGRTSSNPSS